MKRKTSYVLVAGTAVLAGLYAAFALNRSSPTRYFTAKVERGDIHDVVEATGTINAVITVQVGSQVSGTIAKLFADFNSRVRKGDIVALIDPALFRGALLQATADLENAKANLVAAQANLEKATAAFAQAKADYDRAVGLAKDGIASQQQLDQAKANYDSASAGVGGAGANVAQAKAQVSQKQAAVSVAQTNLDYTVIRSPIDGTVVARNVDVGQTVAASLQAPTIFTIAQDLTKMLVYAKTDESDVGSIQPGKPVTFKVDAFPKETFRGVVSQVRMNATMVQNVVTYDTIIEFANPERKLFPGMTAYVTIPVATAEKVLKLPNASLRFKPPLGVDELRTVYAKYGIEPGNERQAKGQSSGEAAPPTGRAPGGGTERPSKAARADSAVVWRLHADNSLEPMKVELGITDHTFTECVRIVKGELKEGDELVTGSVTAKTQLPGALRK